VNFPAELVAELSWHLERFAEPGEQGLVLSARRALRFDGPTSGLSGIPRASKLAYRVSTFMIFAT